MMWKIRCGQIPGTLIGLVAGICIGAGMAGHSQVIQTDKSRQSAAADTPPLVELIIPNSAINKNMKFSADRATFDAEWKMPQVFAGNVNVDFGNGTSLKGNQALLSISRDKTASIYRFEVRSLVAVPPK